MEFFDRYVSTIKQSYISLNLTCKDFSFDDSTKSKLFTMEITKLRNNNQKLLSETDQYFKKLENPTIIQNQHYSDDEKLCFHLNYFNLKLLHHILFKESRFPKSYSEWKEFIVNTKFILFGYRQRSLFWLDQVVIRYLSIRKKLLI